MSWRRTSGGRGPRRGALNVALVVAEVVADGQVLLVAVAAFAARFDVFQRGLSRAHRRATHPARHHAVQLPGHGLVNLVAREGEGAHGKEGRTCCYA